MLQRHPFPGDFQEESNRWVTDVALDFIREYDPEFVYLTYAEQYYNSRYTQMTAEARTDMITAAVAEAERFIRASGFTPVLVGTGDMTDFLAFIDVARLDGLALSTHWSARYAGLHGPSAADMESLKALPKIERIVPGSDLVSLFKGTPEQARRVPEYLLVAKEGYAFKTAGQAHRKLAKIPGFSMSRGTPNT